MQKGRITLSLAVRLTNQLRVVVRLFHHAGANWESASRLMFEVVMVIP
jgi:hypothetical protein